MEEEAGRRMERGEGDQLRGATTGSRRVAAAVVGASGGEIEIQMEAATVGSGASAAAAAASTSSGQEGDAEDGLQQVPSRFSIFFSASLVYSTCVRTACMHIVVASPIYLRCSISFIIIENKEFVEKIYSLLNCLIGYLNI